MLYWSGKFIYLFLIIAPFLSMLTVFHNIAFSDMGSSTSNNYNFIKDTSLFILFFFFLVIFFLGLLSPVLWGMLSKYQQNRIITFQPEKDPLEQSYHIIQSKTAIGSGGLFGKGWERVLKLI